MIISYLRTAIRILKRDKIQSILNISGLAIGICCFLLIYLFVKDEWSYDRFHEAADRTYRVVHTNDFLGEQVVDPLNFNGLASGIARDIPGIASVTQIINPEPEVLVSASGESSMRSGFLEVDATFLEVFDFSLLSGNPEKALRQPNSMVLTAEQVQ